MGSLGRVYSLAVTGMVFGKKGLQRYEKLRRKDFARECSHNGKEVWLVGMGICVFAIEHRTRSQPLC